MSNTIYNKLRTKRKYVRKPKCKNKLKTCTFEKCRCKPMKLPAKLKKPLTEAQVEEIKHREKVIAVKRREFMQAIDAEVERMIVEPRPSIVLKNSIPFEVATDEEIRFIGKPQKTFWQKIVEFCSQILP